MSVSAATAQPSQLLSVLSPQFRGIPDAGALARYLVRALVTIKREGLPVRIYLSQDLVERVGGLLAELGVRFRAVPVSRLEPPYILLDTEGGSVVLRTVDEGGRVVAQHAVPLAKFVEALEALLRRGRGRRGEERTVSELVIAEEDLQRFLERLESILREEGEGRS